MTRRRFNPDCSDRELMYRAAREIEDLARCLRDSNSIEGRWFFGDHGSHEDRRKYRELRQLVREIRARAKDAE